MSEVLSDAQRQRFQRLMWPLIPDVLRFARFLTRHDQEAEDLAQETMVRAMRSIDQFEEGTSAKAWLLTIARRLLIDQRRLKRNQPMASLDAARAAAPADDAHGAVGVFDEQWREPEDLLRRFGDEQIVEALRTLPEEIRWTLLLVDVEQMEHAEAAAVLDIPVGTIKSRAFRGRRMLRDELYTLAQALGWIDEKASESP